MAVDKAIYVPLFSESSLAVESPFFTVFPGEVAHLQAYGFMDEKVRTDNTELRVSQKACLEMVLFKEEIVGKRDGSACPIMDLKRFKSKVLAIETMRLNNKTFSLSKCNNTMLINIPGAYRFVMNDASSLGNARIYLRIFSHEEFPWDSKFFIGE